MGYFARVVGGGVGNIHDQDEPHSEIVCVCVCGCAASQVGSGARCVCSSWTERLCCMSAGPLTRDFFVLYPGHGL